MKAIDGESHGLPSQAVLRTRFTLRWLGGSPFCVSTVI